MTDRIINGNLDELSPTRTPVDETHSARLHLEGARDCFGHRCIGGPVESLFSDSNEQRARSSASNLGGATPRLHM